MCAQLAFLVMFLTKDLKIYLWVNSPMKQNHSAKTSQAFAKVGLDLYTTLEEEISTERGRDLRKFTHKISGRVKTRTQES